MTSSYQRAVAVAVDDPEWQRFRLSLKGLPTQEKLQALQVYYEEYSYAETNSVDWSILVDRRVQVDNYIKALCRGGQLYPGESLQSMIDQDWKPDIKK